ncbi:hypothetical protein D6825_02320, partial [Candidatus Woesearchaeota archaeon]
MSMLLAIAGIADENKRLGAALLGLFALLSLTALAKTGIINPQKFFSTILPPLIALGALAAAIAYILGPERGKNRREQSSGKKPQKKSPQSSRETIEGQGLDAPGVQWRG